MGSVLPPDAGEAPLFPLPAMVVGASSTRSSARLRARERDRALLGAVTNETITALNEVYMGSENREPAQPGDSKSSRAHVELLKASKRLRCDRRAPGCPEPTGGAAFKSLYKPVGSEELYAGCGVNAADVVA